MYGANVGEWKSKWLWLYIEEVKSPQGGMTLGIRIRDKKDEPAAASQPQQPKQPAEPPAHPLAAPFAAMKLLWKKRREANGLSVTAEEFKLFIASGTEGLIVAANVMRPDAYTIEVIAKLTEAIEFEMPPTAQP